MSTLDSSEGGFDARLSVSVRGLLALLGAGASLAGIVSLGFLLRGRRVKRLESLEYAVEIATKAVAGGCSWPLGARFLSSHFGMVERLPQPFDEFLAPSFHGRFLMFYGPTGTGKSHYINAKLEEERDGFFIHVPCNDHPIGKTQGLTPVVLGQVLGIHEKQYENSSLILDRVIRDLCDSGEPRVLVVFEDPAVKSLSNEVAVGMIKNALGWCKEDIADVVVAQSEYDTLRQIEDHLSGTQGVLRYGEYDPPTEEAVIAMLDEGLLMADPALSGLSRDNAISFLSYVGVQFAELSNGWARLNGEETLEDVKEHFGHAWEEKILRTVNGVAHDERVDGRRDEDDLAAVLVIVLEDDFLPRSNVDPLLRDYLVRTNVLRSLPDGYTWSKRGMRVGAERYFSGRGIDVGSVANAVLTEDGEIEILLEEKPNEAEE